MRSSIPLWRKIQRENFTNINSLIQFLDLSEENGKKIWKSPTFPLNLPRRLAEKIQKNTLDDPILRQFVPLLEETVQTPGFTPEPVQDTQFQKSKKILQKYNSRALIIATSACAMNCRFCFRQNFPYETKTVGFSEEIAYLSKDPTISEVILSGGDPLSLSDASLTSLFQSLNAIPHVKRIRFHSRFPIGIPERIDASFLNLLASSTKQIFFVLHSNHPRELDTDVLSALQKMGALQIPLLNQSVLLKGVNDDPATLLALSETLLNHGILPYYLHKLDPVSGASHFALSETRGLELTHHLQQHTSGFGVPRFVREDPGAASKTFL